jgi:hypothetical protein
MWYSLAVWLARAAWYSLASWLLTHHPHNGPFHDFPPKLGQRFRGSNPIDVVDAGHDALLEFVL